MTAAQRGYAQHRAAYSKAWNDRGDTARELAGMIEAVHGEVAELRADIETVRQHMVMIGDARHDAIVALESHIGALESSAPATVPVPASLVAALDDYMTNPCMTNPNITPRWMRVRDEYDAWKAGQDR